MAANHPLTNMVAGIYNKANQDFHLLCRRNDEDLTEQQKAVFDSLGEEIKKRYFGSGLVIPENVTGKRILDICCGSGSLVFILSKLVGPTGYVVGIDISDGLIETAKSQAEYHYKQWGYDKPNFEFQHLNAEKLDEANFSPGEFDHIVSNGSICLIPDKKRVFEAAFKLLKPGGQFFLNDVYAEVDPPEEYSDNQLLWCEVPTGALRWDTLAPMAGGAGFTTPHLTSAAPVLIAKEEYKQMLKNARYSCAGWRLFKLPPSAAKQGPALVTYNGGISHYPDAFPWDIDLTFKKGVGVEVDGELATLLSNIYLSHCFSLQPVKGQPTTRRNQNPFELMDKLEAEGKLPDYIYKV